MYLFKRIRISTRLVMIFIAMLFLIVFMGTATLHSVGLLNEAMQESAKWFPRTILIQSISVSVADVRLCSLLVPATNNALARQQLLARRESAVERLKELTARYEHAPGNDAQRQIYSKVALDMKTWLAISDQAMILADQEKQSEAQEMLYGPGADAAQKLQLGLDLLAERSKAESGMARNRFVAAWEQVSHWVWGVIAGVAFVVFVLTYFLARTLSLTALRHSEAGPLRHSRAT